MNFPGGSKDDSMFGLKCSTLYLSGADFADTETTSSSRKVPTYKVVLGVNALPFEFHSCAYSKRYFYSLCMLCVCVGGGGA